MARKAPYKVGMYFFLNSRNQSAIEQNGSHVYINVNFLICSFLVKVICNEYLPVYIGYVV